MNELIVFIVDVHELIKLQSFGSQMISLTFLVHQCRQIQ